MVPKEQPDHVANAAAEFSLSCRGAHNSIHCDVWGPRENLMRHSWTPENPSGTVLLRLAENTMLHDDVVEHIRDKIEVLPVNHLTYSTGPRGSMRLRNAAAQHLITEFEARRPVTADNIFVTPGLSSAIDALVWAICDDGQGVLIPRPYYNGFDVDIASRSNAKIIGVSYDTIESYTTLDDVFSPQINERALGAALRQAQEECIDVRALLICHPHNPLGRCYPIETLKVFASFCGHHNLHFISDEIYAKSTFENASIPWASKFHSSLSLDLKGVLDDKLFHMLYGASKDFCANGLRLGFVYTRNKGILGAMSSISTFSWTPHLLQDAWSSMLEDQEWMRKFFAKNKTAMVANYSIATSFCNQHSIPYYETNVGIFFWIDLGRFLLPEGSMSVLKVSSAEAAKYKARELALAELCSKNGVMISPGHIYHSEFLGWYRVTCSTSPEALREGLKRIWKSIKELEAIR